DVRAVVDDDVHLDLGAAHLGTAPLLRVHALHLRGRVGGVAREHVGRDVAMPVRHDHIVERARSPRAARRTGTAGTSYRARATRASWSSHGDTHRASTGSVDVRASGGACARAAG